MHDGDDGNTGNGGGSGDDGGARGGARKILEVGASAAHDDEQTRASGTGEGAR